MSYSEIAKLDILSAANAISSENELLEFRNVIARFFAEKAQKAIDKLWEDGTINDKTISDWGSEHMRTRYRYAIHRS